MCFLFSSFFSACGWCTHVWYTCGCGCAYLCVCVFVCVCIHVGVGVLIFMCVVYSCVYTCMCGCAYLCVCVVYSCVIHVCVSVLIYVYGGIFMCVYTCMCVCSSVCVLKPKAGDWCLPGTNIFWDRVSGSGACCLSCTDWSANPRYLAVSIPTCRCWGAPSFHRFWGFKPSPRACMKNAFPRNHLPGPSLSQT